MQKQKNKQTPCKFFTFLTSNLLPEVLTNFLWGGKQAEEHDHPSRKLHNRGHQEGVLHTATVSTLFQCLVVGNVKWGGGGGGNNKTCLSMCASPHIHI